MASKHLFTLPSSFFLLLLLLLLLPHVCTGARYRFSEAAAGATDEGLAGPKNTNALPAYRRSFTVDHRYVAILGVLPRGGPVPPSAPSKRHNSIHGDHSTAGGGSGWTTSP